MKLFIPEAKVVGSLVFMGMTTTPNLEPKLDMEKKQKVTEDGKPLYNARGLTAVQMRDGVPSGSDNSVTLALTEQPVGGVHFGQLYRLEGPVTFTHYVQNDNRLGLSIQATRIVRVEKTSGGENK